jgi:hypothetical protein
MNEAYIVDYRKTPIGKYCGRLSLYHPDDLASFVIADIIIAGAGNGAIDRKL